MAEVPRQNETHFRHRSKWCVKTHLANPTQGWCRDALRIALVVTSALVVVLEFANTARAATLYWDTDGSTGGNDMSTGANLGGSGIWSSADANWWVPNLGTPQVWTD